MSLYEDIKTKIISHLEQAANSAKEKGELNFEELPNFVLEEPRERQHGDLATNLALVMAKQAKRSPRDIAATLIQHLDKTGTWIEASEIAGAGFINLRLNPLWLTGVIKENLQGSPGYSAFSHQEHTSPEIPALSWVPRRDIYLRL